MTFELSLQIKILALVGLLLAAGAAATLMLAQSHSASEPPLTHALTRPAQSQSQSRSHGQSHGQSQSAKPSATHTAPQSHAVVLDPGLPGPLAHALERSRTVVAVVYAPGDRADAQVLAEARAGAARTGVGFVALNIRSDAIAGATAVWMHHVVDPAVVVVGRPGTIAAELDGYADSTMVAQAVVDVRG